MDWWLLFAVFLYMVCAVLIVAEVFIPSGGLLGTASLVVPGGRGVALLSAQYGGGIGRRRRRPLSWCRPCWCWRTRYCRDTRFGRRVLLAPPVRQRGEAITDAPELSELLGRTGRVLTPMRPVGMCDFDGRRVECVAESGYVAEGQTVKVIRVEGTQVTVRVVEEA